MYEEESCLDRVFPFSLFLSSLFRKDGEPCIKSGFLGITLIFDLGKRPDSAKK